MKEAGILDYFESVVLGQELPSIVHQAHPRMTFDDFKYRVEQTLRNRYGTRLCQRSIFDDNVLLAPKWWQAQFTVDGKQRLFVFEYGIPPVEAEAVRFTTKLDGFCQELP